MNAAVYKIENKITKDCYIGSSVNYAYRKWCHIKRLREGIHHSIILQNSWNKYGESMFSFSILEIITDNAELIKREQYYIDTESPKYNVSKIAGSPLGVKHTQEARKNMSTAHRREGYKMNHKPDCRCSVCHHKSGVKRKQKTILKMREGANNKKAVQQFTISEEFIKEWTSTAEAGRETKIQQSHIGACCRKEYGRKSIGGFLWRYK